MIIETLPHKFAICKVQDWSQVELDAEFCFVGSTDGERSLVCLADAVPDNAIVVDCGWRAFRVQGELDFSLTGILAGIATAIAQAGVGIFAVSTFNTDYVLVKSTNYGKALGALRDAGYTIEC